MPRVDGPSYQELESGARPYSNPTHDGHPLYGLAAFAYHHAHELPGNVRRGLFIALDAVWPRTQGDKKETEYRALAAFRAAEQGTTIDDIAREFGVTSDRAARWVRSVKKELESPESVPAFPRVETVFAEGGDVPEDPAADLVYARWMARSPTELERQLQDERHLRRLLNPSAETKP
jgi:transposase-like protein